MVGGGSEVGEPVVQGEVALLAIAGELDADCAPMLAAAIGGSAGLHGVRRVELDLTAVTFMDSGGLAAIVRAKMDLALRSVALDVRAVSPAVARLLEVTGMEGRLQRPRD